ncbi:MAG: hypothetical protein JWM11_2596 [Planctomycetaceae bacterium]|nr:hypothetical protein [Planctomycetaceae bacterium]
MVFENSLQSDLDWLAFQYAAGELHGTELVAFESRLANDLAAGEALAKAVLLGQMVAACEWEMANSSVTANSNFGLPHSVVADAASRQDLRPEGARGSVSPKKPEREMTAADARVFPTGKSRRPAVSWHVLALLGSAACLALMTSWMGSGRPEAHRQHASEMTAGLVSLWIDGAETAPELNNGASERDVSGATATTELVSLRPTDVLNGDSQALETHSLAAGVSELDGENDGEAVPGWMLAAVAERQREMGDPEGEVLQD